MIQKNIASRKVEGKDIPTRYHNISRFVFLYTLFYFVVRKTLTLSLFYKNKKFFLEHEQVKLISFYLLKEDSVDKYINIICTG